jgi:hypothetical protein
MTRLTLFAICALAALLPPSLVGLSIWEHPAWTDPLAPRDLTDNEKRLAADSLRKRLRDPDSAEFRWPKLRPDRKLPKQAWAYCGEVNASNGFGGYVGFRRFLTYAMHDGFGSVTEFILLDISKADSDFEAQLIENMCQNLGY